MPKATKEELAAFDIPWGKIGCILEAVAGFGICELRGGTDCVDTLVTDIRNCLSDKQDDAANAQPKRGG